MTLAEAHTLISPAAVLLHASTSPLHWIDLGCGSGLFTEALALLLPKDSSVTGIDTKPTLRPQTTKNEVTISTQKADFIKSALPFHDLDGILMANSLHYVKDKPALLKRLQTYMRPGSSFIIVEYDTDRPTPIWVPYPLSYNTLTKLFSNTKVQKLGERPSVYGRSNIYAALIRQ